MATPGPPRRRAGIVTPGAVRSGAGLEPARLPRGEGPSREWRLARVEWPAYTRRMYGYEPPNPAKVGGCRDTLTIVRVAFEVLTPIFAAGIGALAYVALTFWLFTISVALGLVPVAVAVLALVWLALRDRRTRTTGSARSSARTESADPPSQSAPSLGYGRCTVQVARWHRIISQASPTRPTRAPRRVPSRATTRADRPRPGAAPWPFRRASWRATVPRRPRLANPLRVDCC